MRKVVCILLLFIIVVTLGKSITNAVLNIENMIDFNKVEEDCKYTEDSIKYPILGGNIPTDNLHEITKIGYNLNSVKKEGNYMVDDTLSSNIKLRKPILKYDGIYKSTIVGFDNKEKQIWTLDGSKHNMGVYGDDRLLK
tara:strand:+ start:1249 stop:1665 length:417 start_codon:yes stop_codon:yes gene_type:complete